MSPPTGNRPQYETPADLSRQERVAVRLEIAWKCELHPLPISYGWDYGMFRGDVMLGVVEIKCRDQKYDTLFISLAKLMRGRDYQQAGFATFLVVSWPDGVYWVKNPEPDELRTQWGGRNDRGDPQDMEPVCHIPVDAFRRLE